MESGRLLLVDPATDTAIDLWAFGETNADAFGRFLKSDPALATTAKAEAAMSKPEVTAMAVANEEKGQ